MHLWFLGKLNGKFASLSGFALCDCLMALWLTWFVFAAEIVAIVADFVVVAIAIAVGWVSDHTISCH